MLHRQGERQAPVLTGGRLSFLLSASSLETAHPSGSVPERTCPCRHRSPRGGVSSGPQGGPHGLGGSPFAAEKLAGSPPSSAPSPRGLLPRGPAERGLCQPEVCPQLRQALTPRPLEERPGAPRAGQARAARGRALDCLHLLTLPSDVLFLASKVV